MLDFTATHFPLGAILVLLAYLAWYKLSTRNSGIKEQSMTCPFCGLTAKRDTGPNGGETYSCASHVWGAEVQRLASRLSLLESAAKESAAKLADAMTRLDMAQDELSRLRAQEQKVEVEA